MGSICKCWWYQVIGNAGNLGKYVVMFWTYGYSTCGTPEKHGRFCATEGKRNEYGLWSGGSAKWVGCESGIHGANYKQMVGRVLCNQLDGGSPRSMRLFGTPTGFTSSDGTHVLL
ncbi:hypothetical protein MRB53_004706 [Persea americana]|uniref:Uncharacterized protein n=1 Tax=Persea americana TaxID=3435 RepID=A0ACC2MC00_PERAE|nr:hypothetical protein MRB53_004706 [Persea americana]